MHPVDYTCTLSNNLFMYTFRSRQQSEQLPTAMTPTQILQLLQRFAQSSNMRLPLPGGLLHSFSQTTQPLNP